MPRLRIVLISPLAAGSGLGQPGVVDRDVIYDPETGLVLISSKRIKGLLLDSYRDILAWGVFDSANLPAPETVFGSPGQERPGRLRLGNAYLVADSETPFAGSALAASLRAVVSHQNSPIRARDVLRCFTEVRRQTSIDRSTGAALEDTLRYTRVLREGLVFEASIDGLDEPLLQAAALAAAGVDVMGTSRSRGWGRVRFTVIGDDGQPVPVLTTLAAGGSLAPAPEPAAARILPPVPVDATRSIPSHELRFELSLQDPLLLNSAGAGDPNTNITADHVPGSSIHGVLAHRFVEQAGDAARFHALFCSGRVSFLPAVPLVEVDGEQVPAMPVPHSVRSNKEVASDLGPEPREFAVEPFDPDYKATRVRGWFAPGSWQRGQRSPKVTVRRSIQYHHQRAADTRVQRALGAESDDVKAYGLTPFEGGALFVYESLSPGQTFAGTILGNPEDLAAVKALIADGGIVRFGRSRSVQYGGRAVWKWGELAEFEPIASSRENRVIVRLLTPLVARNANGHPCAEFPLAEFDAGARIVRAFTRRELVGGYWGHQNLPKEQMYALSAGSTFVLAGVSVGLREAASKSYGIRTEEGFGRIAIFETSLPRQLFEKPEPPLASIGADAAVRKLAGRVLRQQIEDYAANRARAVVANTARIGRISPHLIHRLIRALEGPNPFETLIALLTAARRHAREQLDAVRVANATLAGFLRHTIENRAAAFRELAAIPSNTEWSQLLGHSPHAATANDTQFVDTVVRVYLLRYLSALARERKKHAN